MISTDNQRGDLDTDVPPRIDDVEAFGKDAQANLPENGADYTGATAKTDLEEIALVRKLDMRIMPSLFCLNFLNKLDQNAIANARLNGLESDLGLSGSQYNTCISILYVGYLFAQIPSNMLMSSKRVRLSLYMASCAILWGCVATLTALVKNYVGLVVVRFFLGFVEAPFYPGAFYILSLFYTCKEIATRVSILYAGNLFAVSFAGLIAAATFATLDGKHGMHGWQWLFAYADQMTVLTAPPSLVAGVVSICVGISSGEFNDRPWHITVMMGIAVIGFIVSAVTLNLPACCISCFLFASGVYSVNSVILGWVSGTLGQTPEKKAVSLSIVNVVSMADGPKYVIAMSSNALFAAASIAAAWTLRTWWIVQNRRLKKNRGDVFYAY
ncbi:major facilitator superfamily domain-containing protein [Ampelomyces quisqualis]|uniref:Major facilitator superfamily domain-containing protein n=1 Tax=Ampelomyces quisqualis TaxID=50730 RepID=A0A6A5QNJ4_AMPQU|nr:major facilitator superfamily domain-containing protein [Ampelomyces quisqualis]